MKQNKIYRIVVIILVLVTILVVGYMSTPPEKVAERKYTEVSKEESEKLPVKIEDIDYELVQDKNKEGYVVMYVRYKNNSNYYIMNLSLSLKGDRDEYFVENLIGVRKGEKSDNFNLSTTKDDGTRMPVKQSKGGYMKEKDNLKIQRILYSVNVRGEEHRYEYDLDSKKYKILYW